MDNCTEVTPACPVEGTTYGYYPNLGVNAALCAVYSILCLLQLILAFNSKIYSYSLSIASGCLVEALGYAGRLMMHNNPWDGSGFKLQIVCLIIGPTFIAAGIYLTLKDFVRLNGPEYSRLKPKLYTWIFIGCDVGSIVVQAIGGGMAAAGDTNSMLKAGSDIIILGIAFQVFTMSVCGILAADYFTRRHRQSRLAPKDSPTHGAMSQKTRIFQAAVLFAYVTVLIRCIYRLPEMAGGWGNPRMRNETDFLILDGLMVALASASLTLCHPGYLFPVMKAGYTSDSSNSLSDSSTHIRLDSLQRNG